MSKAPGLHLSGTRAAYKHAPMMKLLPAIENQSIFMFSLYGLGFSPIARKTPIVEIPANRNTAARNGLHLGVPNFWISEVITHPRQSEPMIEIQMKRSVSTG